MAPPYYRRRAELVQAMRVPPADDLHAWGELAGWLMVDMAAFELHGPDDGYGVSGVTIHTTTGDDVAEIGDWIVRDTFGAYSRLTPGMFDALYEEESTTPPFAAGDKAIWMNAYGPPQAVTVLLATSGPAILASFEDDEPDHLARLTAPADQFVRIVQ